MGKVHAGYKCAECGRDISGQAFTRVEEIRLARQKMKEAQDALRELGDIDGAGGIDAQAGQATEIKVGLTD